MVPNKLQAGDQIRIVALSGSLATSWITKEVKELSDKQLKHLGFKVTFGAHVNEIDLLGTSSIRSRVFDLHEAFRDPSVQGIISVVGGYSTNQILGEIDYDLIRKHPKVVCGYSDITALLNAIHSKAEVITYHGPHFINFGMKKGAQYITRSFQQCLMKEGAFRITPAKKWSDDRWVTNQEKRKFHSNSGFWTINNGVANGRIVGGNLNTFTLLHGTPFMPSLRGAILFLEDTGSISAQEFDRLLQSTIDQSDFAHTVGLVIGRFEKGSGINRRTLEKIISQKPCLEGKTIVANVDFGHTLPFATLPIGGNALINATKEGAEIEITLH